MVSKLLGYIFFHRWPWRLLIIGVSFLGAVLGILGPYLQKHFIDRLLTVPSQSILGFEGQLSPLILILFAFFCLLMAQALGFFANYLGMKESLILQKELSEKIYEKTLALRPDSTQGKTVGEMVSIYASDVMGATIFIEQSLPTGASTLFPLILAPIGLFWLFQMPLHQVLMAIGLVVTVNSLLAMRQSRYFTRFKQLAAERLGLVNEWIVNMKALKVLGWTEAYEKKIRVLRETETQNRVAMVTNGQTMNSISSTVTFVINVIAIYVLIHGRSQAITPGELLSLLWILGIFLTRPFRQLPWFFTFGFDGWTSLKRIAHFLSLKNRGRDWDQCAQFEEGRMEVSGPRLEVQNLSLSIDRTPLLKNLSFNIAPKEFVAIVGEVGSGKSLLLLSLMGETGADFDVYRINHRNMLTASHGELCRHFAYVPQEGFVMSATLRENIAFDYNTNNKLDARITDCLTKAQFPLEKEKFPEQLETDIGERGVNLSGGQKQRVSIARADYYDCPIVLMDDSLSALDVNTEHHLIETLLKGRWSEKTRLLATHRLSVLKEVDRILFLEAGQIVAQGTLKELLATSEKFQHFIESLQTQSPPPQDSELPVSSLVQGETLMVPHGDPETQNDPE